MADPTTTIESKIEKTLLDFIGAFPSGSPALAIAYPNIGFTPVVTQPYLRVAIIWPPDSRRRLGVAFGSSYLHQGMMQVAAFYPINKGPLPAAEMAGKLIDYAAEGTKLPRIVEDDPFVVSIGRMDGSPGAPYRGTAIPEPNWYSVPVWIPWTAAVPGR